MAQFLNIPAKVISGSLLTSYGSEYWPYETANDPYWQFGSSPKFYRWNISLSITPQSHSCPFTRVPNSFTGMDIQIGDYVADTVNGIAVKIISITSKSDFLLECEVEDSFRYNTFRDVNQSGNGIFTGNIDVVVFSVNEDGMPMLDPASSDSLGTNFYNNLNSRFQNLEKLNAFVIEQEDHGFQFGEIIAVDTANAVFARASAQFPYVVGSVSAVMSLGPNAFAVDPFEKLIDKYDYLPGTIGSIIYSDDSGEVSLVGNRPLLIKISNQSNTIVYGTIGNAITTPGDTFTLNGNTVTVSSSNGTASMEDFADSVNAFSSQTGVSAYTFTPANIVTSTGGNGYLQVPASASINNTVVSFTSSYYGGVTGSPGFSLFQDMANDINNASIPNLVASVIIDTSGFYQLTLTEANGNAIQIVNVTPDGLGNDFAGPSGSVAVVIPLFTPAVSNTNIALGAIDARAINLYDTNGGSATTDMGLYSAENGQKAAALVIDQGVRQASTYVVANLAARDSLNAMFGDQAFVQDVGDGTWAYYLYSFDSTWVTVSTQPSSETDAQTIEVDITPSTANTAVIHTITNGRRVSFVTVTVSEAFNSNATVSVGDSGQDDRLMTVDENDLTVVGDYSTTPSYTYTSGSDTNISFYFDVAGATVGNAVVAITYT